MPTLSDTREPMQVIQEPQSGPLKVGVFTGLVLATLKFFDEFL